MTTSPSAAKHFKLDEKQILIDFLNKKDLCERWLGHVEYVWHCKGYIPPVACSLKIETANAGLCRSFSNAHCSVRCHYDKDDTDEPIVIGMSKLFKKGCTLLLAFLKERLVPEDREELNSLMCLITYLLQSSPTTVFTEEANDGKKTERNWCLKMAQHLFSQLSQSKNYIIDRKYGGDSSKVCPCVDKDELFGTFDDTSFGCKTLWHGSADLLYGIPLQFASPVYYSESESEPENSVTDDCSSIGIEVNRGNEEKDKFKMRAQVIGFSFYIQKVDQTLNKDKAKWYLIPHIGFSKEKICFRFYDSVNDILLETMSIDLFEHNKKLSKYAILLTWLVLNYKVLGEKTPKCLLAYKSGFHEMFSYQLTKYKEEVEHPCHVKQSYQKEDLPLHTEDSDSLNYEEEKSLCRLICIDDI